MTTVISVNFDEESGDLVILGETARIIRNPVFATFLRTYHGLVLDEGRITIPTTRDELDRRYQGLTKILGRIGIILGEAENLSGTMRQIRDEVRQFIEFGERAKAIWNQDLVPDEFQEFVEVMEKRCTGRTFYRLQLLSAYHLAFAQNACNFSVPGAGKTSVVYAAYAYLNSLGAASEKYVNHILVVGPLSSFKAWEDEFKEIFGRPARARRIFGAMPPPQRRDYLRGIEFGANEAEITLTSYQTLNSAELDFRAFLEHPDRRTMMVLDEAHYIKREDGQWASSALGLAPLARSRVVLTGTPAPNGYEDLANLFQFIYPNKQIIRFHSGALRAMTEDRMQRSAIERLKSSIRPFFTRIRKRDLEIPEPREQRVDVPFSEVQERIYRGIERLVVPRLRDAAENHRPGIFSARLIRLRQAATNPALLLRPIEADPYAGPGISDTFSASEMAIVEGVRKFRPEHDLERLRIATELADQIIEVQGKVLIWSYFIGNLELLRRVLTGHADFVEVITGATPVAGYEDETEIDLETREAIIDRFHNPDETAILIANPQAVGESISLHKACHSAIYYDRDFNAGRYIQSKDRIHRYGLLPTDTTDYYYLVTARTVDEDIDQRLIVKERRLMDLVDTDDVPLFGLADDEETTLEDIRAMIRSYERRKTV